MFVLVCVFGVFDCGLVFAFSYDLYIITLYLNEFGWVCFGVLVDGGVLFVFGVCSPAFYFGWWFVV